MKALLSGILVVFLVLVNFPLHADVVVVDKAQAEVIVKKLQSEGVQARDWVFPEIFTHEDVVITEKIDWDSTKNLVIATGGNIIFNRGGKIVSRGGGSIILKAGLLPGHRGGGKGRVVFAEEEPQVELKTTGKVKIYYNPEANSKGSRSHKYHNGESFTLGQHVAARDLSEALTIYMLVNNVRDLQDINLFLAGNYALSQGIDARETQDWNQGAGFKPLWNQRKNMPFSGDFDGNGYTIRNLFIHRPQEDKVGLFGECSGFASRPNVVENLILQDFRIKGDHYVGSLAGIATHTNFYDIGIGYAVVEGRDIVGGMVGAAYRIAMLPVTVYYGDTLPEIIAQEYKGLILGSANESKVRIVLAVANQQEQAEAIARKPPYD